MSRKPDRTRAGREPHPQRILFIRSDRLGEVLLNLPALRAIHEAWPKAHVTLLAAPHLLDLLSALPDVHAVVPFQLGRGPWWSQTFRLSGELRRLRFDAAVVSNPHKIFHLATWLARIPVRVGYSRKWGCLLTHAVPDRKWLGEQHEVAYNLELLVPLGITTSPPTVVLPVRPQAVQDADRLLGPRIRGRATRLVAVHPWSSNPNKQWPIERARALAGALAQESGLHVVIVGGEDVTGQADALCRDLPGGITNLAGRCSWTQTAAVLKRCRVLVSTDSGPMHLAAALGTPCVALFGTSERATGPARWGPWGTGHTVIHRAAPAGIEVTEVLAAVRSYLRESPGEGAAGCRP